MKKSLVKNSIYNIIYKVVTALYPLVAVTYVSHVLQSDRVGIVSYAQNIVSYFAVFAALGIPTYGIREVAVRSSDQDEQSKLFWELFTINFISTSVAIVAYVIVIFTTNRFYLNYQLYLIAGLQIFLNYFNVDWFYQGIEDYKYISIRSIVVKMLALVALPLLVRKPDDYINYALIYCLAIAGNNILNTLRLRKYILLKRYKLSLRRHMKSIAILLMVSVAVEIYAMIDTTMLGIYCDDKTVGCYSNAMKLTRMVNTTAAAIGAVLFPRLSVIFNHNEKGKFEELVNMGIKIMLMIAVPAAVGMILLSDSIILVLFGQTFVDAIPILRILALMVPVVVCNTLMGGQVLVTTNQEDKYVLSVTAASVVNVVLNALLIPRYGATSAAVASLISEVIDLILYIHFSKKYLRLHINMKYWTSLAIPVGIYAVVSIFVLSKLNIGNMGTLVVNILCCAAIYFGLGMVMKNEAMVFARDKFMNILKR